MVATKHTEIVPPAKHDCEEIWWSEQLEIIVSSIRLLLLITRPCLGVF